MKDIEGMAEEDTLREIEKKSQKEKEKDREAWNITEVKIRWAQEGEIETGRVKEEIHSHSNKLLAVQKFNILIF